MKKEKTTNTNPEQKKGAKIAMKIVNIFINTLIIVVLLMSILIATLALTSKSNNGVPSIFGYSFHTIMSPSMEGGSDVYEGGDYRVGDLVIGKATNGNPNEVYEVGDIVVYTTQNDNLPDGVEMICHRVIARDQQDDGSYLYTTKGDNNDEEDQAKHGAADIVAVCYDHSYKGAVWRGFGNVLNYLRTSQGFFLVVLLPMIIFFLYEILRVVMNALNYKKAKSVEDKADAEREKQEAVDAAVKAALAAVGKTADDVPAADAFDDAADAPADDSTEVSDLMADLDEAVSDAKPAEPKISDEDMEEFKQFLAFKEAQKAKKSEEE